MKILKIVLLAACAGLMLAGIAVFILAKTLLTPPVIKDALAFEIKRQLGREMSCGTIAVDLFKGIRVQELRIHKSLPWEDQDLLTCQELRLQHSLAPLLLKKLLIKQIAAINPQIHVQLGRDRPFRLQGTARPDPAAAPSLGIMVMPARIRLIDGKIVLNDLSRQAGLELNRVQATADGISLLTPLRFDLRAEPLNCPSATLACNGTYSLRTGMLTAEAVLDQLALQGLDQLLAEYGIPLRKGQLAMRAKAASSGQGTLNINSTCSVTAADVIIRSMPASDVYVGLEGVDLNMEVQSAYDPSRGELAIQKINGQVLSSPCNGSGTIRRAAGGAAIDGTLQAPGFQLDNLFNRLVIRGAGLPQSLRLAGPVDLQFHMTGALPGSLAPVLILNLKGNPILYPQLGWLRPQLKGELRIDSRNISVNNVTLGTENMAVTLSGAIAGYAQWPPRSSLNIASSRIDFPKLFAARDTELGEEIGPLDLGGLFFEGPIKLESSTFFGMKLTDVRGSYLFKNSRLHIQELQGAVEQGRFTVSSTLDLAAKGLDYYTHLRFSEVPLKSILAMFPGYNANFISGMLSGTCTIKGSGTQPAHIVQNLKGDAIINIANASIKGLALIPQISSFIRGDKLGEVAFSAANVKFTLADGIIEVAGALLSPYLELYPAGQIGLDSALNLEVKLRVSPEALAVNSRLAQYLPQENGWPTLPMIISGTFQRPRVALSEEALNFIVKKTLPQLLMDLLSQKRAAGADGKVKGLPPPQKREDQGDDDDAAPEPDTEEDNATQPEDDEE